MSTSVWFNPYGNYHLVFLSLREVVWTEDGGGGGGGGEREGVA